MLFHLQQLLSSSARVHVEALEYGSGQPNFDIVALGGYSSAGYSSSRAMRYSIRVPSPSL